MKIPIRMYIHNRILTLVDTDRLTKQPFNTSVYVQMFMIKEQDRLVAITYSTYRNAEIL